MEAVIGAVAEEERVAFVSALIVIVAQLMVDGNKIFVANLDAHLETHGLVKINVPRAGVADNVTVAGLHEQRALPKSFLRLRKSKRAEEANAIADHAVLVYFVVFQKLRQVVAFVGIGRRDQRINVAPLLRPHVPS